MNLRNLVRDFARFIVHTEAAEKPPFSEADSLIRKSDPFHHHLHCRLRSHLPTCPPATGATPIGIIMARGDLAVELGFERWSEVQEESLWICEAAHVPVIWATQVLEDMAKTGMPSRAEVTDAAMSGRAECVMLNKGPYMVDVVGFLSGVLERMESHQTKTSAMLRMVILFGSQGNVVNRVMPRWEDGAVPCP
jgi:hypothetical protein